MSDRPRAILVLRAPPTSPALQYRPYEERWGPGTLLDWLIARLRARSPDGVPIVCISESPAERARLLAARILSAATDVMYLDSRGERHLCRLLMNHFGVSRLIVVGFSHAVAPVEMFRHLMHVHTALSAELSEITHATFRNPAFVVESTLLDEMENAALPNLPETVIQAAEVLRTARAKDLRLARDFLWARVDAAKRFKLSAGQWPEQIAIRQPSDVGILRQACKKEPNPDGQGGLVQEWKNAAIARSRSTFNFQGPGSAMDSRVRVLYVVHLPGFTGAHQSMCHLVGALDRQCYEPIALVSHEGTFTQELRRRRVTVICPERDIIEPGVASFKYAIQTIRDYKPHILHAQHTVGVGLICAAAAMGVPIVQHVRVPNIASMAHHVHAADAVIAVSSYIRERLGELDIDPAKVEVVLNGVDPDLFYPDSTRKAEDRIRWGIPPEEFVVVMIARMIRNKRHDVVINAMARLRRVFGRGHLVLVGSHDFEHGYQHQLQMILETEGLSRHVTRIEFAPDIRSVLRASDVLALVSKDEPLSRAVLDAMAMGVPPVVSDSGGSKEVIDPGETGLVVRYGDEAALAEALLTLACDDACRLAMGTAAAGKVRTSLTARHCAEKTAAIYRRVLRLKSPPPFVLTRPSTTPAAPDTWARR